MSTYPKLDTDETPSTPLEQGLEVRRQVLGSEYVNRAWDKASPFTRPGQQLITEYAWANVWQREGLDRKQRSLLSKSPLPSLTIHICRKQPSIQLSKKFHPRPD